MENFNLGTKAISCPKCGGTQLSQGAAAEAKDEATCASCGNTFSLNAEIDKIGDALAQSLGDALRKALK